MLNFSGSTTVYLACGCTDLRKSYTGLAAIIKLKFHLDPFSRCMLINMGIGIKEIADRLGHESPQTTWGVYAHLYPGKDRELADELDKIRVPKNN